jgi:hypothetical protein
MLSILRNIIDQIKLKPIKNAHDLRTVKIVNT